MKTLVTQDGTVIKSFCSYPYCKCIVSTSTSQPDPICPKNLPKLKEKENE